MELVSSGRDDKGLQDTLHRLYGFVRSHPFYREWLDEKLLMYDDTIPVGQTVWGQVILQYALDAAEFAQSQLRRAIEQMQGDAAMEKAYLPAFASDLAQLNALYSTLRTGSWGEVCRQLQTIRPERLGSLRGYEDDGKKQLVQRMRKSAQAVVAKLAEQLFCADEQEFAEDIRFLRPRIETLFSLVLDYDRRLLAASGSAVCWILPTWSILPCSCWWSAGTENIARPRLPVSSARALHLCWWTSIRTPTPPRI